MEKLEILESRVHEMMEWIRQLKSEKSRLEEEVKGLMEKFSRLEEESGHWEREKKEIRVRVERILGEIEVLPD